MTHIVTIKNKLILPCDLVDRLLLEKLKRQLTLKNPAYLEAVKHERSIWNIPKNLCFLRRTKGGDWSAPRGFIHELRLLLSNHSVQYKNETATHSMVILFRGELRPDQKKAIKDILKSDEGVLNAPTGSGKTVMALAMIAERRQAALIIVHTKELLYQWRNRIKTFLNIKESEIGLLGDGHKQVEKITIAIINSLYKHIDFVKQYKIGHLIVDECHRVPSRTFSEAVCKFNSKYILGLSATPYRRDGLTKVLHYYMGETVHKMSTKKLQRQHKIMKACVKIIDTKFSVYDFSARTKTSMYQTLMNNLTKNEERNKLIIENIIECLQTHRGTALVVSDRKEHCNILYEGLVELGIKAEILTGDTKDRKGVIDRVDAGKVSVLVSTTQLIGEGFDSSRLSSLFLTTPIKFKGRLLQCIGRILRVEEGKEKAMVFDFRDNHFILKSSLKARMKTYDKMQVTYI